MNTDNHPTVIAYRQQPGHQQAKTAVSRAWIHELVLKAGADDVGIVELDRPELADQRQAVLTAYPVAKTYISYLCRMNTPQLRSVDRSLADHEFIEVDHELNEIGRKVVRTLREHGISSILPAANFPQDMSKWGNRAFVISHKPVAAAAGLGRIGHHRLLIHPKYGSHLCLGTLVIDQPLESYDQPIPFNPCLNCNLCVGVCPTGAISKDGSFDRMTCFIHAYRDRLGGFLRWVDALVESNSMNEYRLRRTDAETMAVWQGLSYGGGYRCGYCMSVCPAGLDLIGPFLDDRALYIREGVAPLQLKDEDVYVMEKDKGEGSLSRRLPNKIRKLF